MQTLTRRRFLQNCIKIGGVAALVQLGISPEEARALVVGYSRNFGTPASDGSIGGSTANASTTASTNRIYHSGSTPDTAGTVRYGHVAVENADGVTVTIKLFSNTGVELLCCSGAASGNGVQWINADSGDTEVLGASTNYYYGAGSTSTFDIYYSDSGGDGFFRDAVTVACGNDLNPEEATQDADGDIRVVWNNSAGNPS